MTSNTSVLDDFTGQPPCPSPSSRATAPRVPICPRPNLASAPAIPRRLQGLRLHVSHTLASREHHHSPTAPARLHPRGHRHPSAQRTPTPPMSATPYRQTDGWSKRHHRAAVGSSGSSLESLPMALRSGLTGLYRPNPHTPTPTNLPHVKKINNAHPANPSRLGFFDCQASSTVEHESVR